MSRAGADGRATRTAGDLIRTGVRGVGQLLVTAGLVILLFVVYELWITDLLSDRSQGQLSEQLRENWTDEPTVAGAPAVAEDFGALTIGEAFAFVRIPRLGADFTRAIVEGTGQVELAQGPGHYVGTALPGEVGNFAVAGHRVGKGSPFLDLDRLRAGDPIVVETAANWYVYRVLGDPATGDFGSDPSGILGQQIVSPAEVSVIAPTPNAAADAAPSGVYLTLTTCHPKFSAEQRLIVHAELEGAPLPKSAAPDGPPALNES